MPDRDKGMLQAFAWLNKYKELRSDDHEALYNLGRAAHQLGLFSGDSKSTEPLLCTTYHRFCARLTTVCSLPTTRQQSLCETGLSSASLYQTGLSNAWRTVDLLPLQALVSGARFWCAASIPCPLMHRNGRQGLPCPVIVEAFLLLQSRFPFMRSVCPRHLPAPAQAWHRRRHSTCPSSSSEVARSGSPGRC